MHLSADDVRSLHKYDLRVLQSIEYLMSRYDWVPVEELIKNSKLSANEVNFRVRRLVDKGMIKFSQIPYPGYCLLYNGYDSLAVSHLAKKGTISALGTLVGVGKESLVYEAIGTGPVILKFHRIGQRSFKTVQRSRGFLPDKGHCPWIFASHFSAEQEYIALSTLHRTVPVPIPILMNRNVVVMSYIAGVNLNAVTLADPGQFFDEIMAGIAGAYKLGFVHGDLSEYNIMTDGQHPVIIDWPQWVAPDHPNAEEILDHDIRTVCQFFQRKYQLRVDPDELRGSVIG
ncbi:RIO1 family regulatory kinase/ATPase [uncultured Methanospirillum sp.]|uniref:serine/threonine-protein kinase RIO2 n=1 Tax=uncultured Methanospirillum sp. TaxID=262503 RepID=UPI0029C8F7C4|nr:RIO1 family regulatory kinase/ATPase [uncultured Methanospirillum sp.]